MKIIVMGCGRVGEAVSRLLASEGHDVAVIDYDASALTRLGLDFAGRTITGVGFDKKVLLEAGIEQADAFVATSSSDNANIVAARIARNIFHVPRVVARLFDPRRADIYRRLGLVTFSSTAWAAGRIRELLTHADLDTTMTFGNGEVSLVSMDASPQLWGRLVNHVSVPGEIIVVAITRDGRAIIPSLGAEFRSGDVISFAVLASAMDRLETLLGLGEN
ncbi:MAG: TrkA family potassium uptake protein [Chloroflexi bacterium]|nr:TrkA family potassium uptake protein [Chloroflexota bacterium]MBI3763352.1 TrkA family potassium uptake protein [Chloroflexota bacterium]